MAKSTQPAEQPATPTKPTSKPPDIPKRVMYLGPNMVEDGVLYSHGQVFNNGLPAEWLARILLEPEFGRLLIPLDTVNKALTELRDSMSMLSVTSKRIASAYYSRRNAPKEVRK